MKAFRWHSISKEQRAFPKRKFAVMALLDGSSSLLGTIGGANTSGQLQVWQWLIGCLPVTAVRRPYLIPRVI